MARTTSILVKGILLADYDSRLEPDLTPFIAAANVIVSRVATCATDKGITLTSAELELIERWVAAHAYVMSDQTYKEKKTEKASGKFQGETKMHFEASKYGQFATSIDPSGCLSALGKKSNTGLFWGGRPPSEQTDYDYRD